MNPQQLQSAEILNQLFATDCGSLLARVPELSLFASSETCGALELLNKAAEQSREHREWLIQAIDAAGAPLRPACLDPRTASLHYTSADAMVPRVCSSLEKLVQVYDEASRRKTLTQPAAELIAHIVRRYRSLLEEFRSVCAA